MRRSNFRSYHRQEGFVLLMSLVMVVAITAIAVSLMSTSSMDMKMATAAEDREMATHVARGGNDELYYNAVNRTINSQNYFAAFSSSTTSAQYQSTHGAVSRVSWASSVQVETDCPRSKDPTEGLMCIYLQATTAKTYGPNNAHQVNVVSGVAQQVGIR